jgi:spore coat protein U-like protein
MDEMKKEATKMIRSAQTLAQLLLLAAFGLWATTQAAQAAISCSVSSPGWISSYFTATVTNTTGASTVTISCTRATTDPTTQTYSLSETNGLQPQGQTNQAISGASLIKYNEYQNATFATQWSPSKPFSGTINFGAGTSASVILTYYYSIPALQVVAAGTYTDTLAMTLTYGASTATNTHPVTILVNPTCTINTAPGAISFSYTSLQPTAAAASTSFAITCTLSLPYTVGLDLYAVTDSAVNLSYTLNVGQSIRPGGSVYTAQAALSASGSGLPQTISIDGSMAAGQAGICSLASCTNAASANKTRTLTITY